jgi:hypothetical protein
LKQIDEDAKFLASMNINDYSLLVGIHYNKEQNNSPSLGGLNARRKNLSPIDMKLVRNLSKDVSIEEPFHRVNI